MDRKEFFDNSRWWFWIDQSCYSISFCTIRICLKKKKSSSVFISKTLQSFGSFWDPCLCSCVRRDGYMGEVTGECYGNSDQGQWDVALEALMALLSVDLNVTQKRIYNLHLIHELWNGDGTVHSELCGSIPGQAWRAINDLRHKKTRDGAALTIFCGGLLVQL